MVMVMLMSMVMVMVMVDVGVCWIIGAGGSVLEPSSSPAAQMGLEHAWLTLKDTRLPPPPPHHSMDLSYR